VEPESSAATWPGRRPSSADAEDQRLSGADYELKFVAEGWRRKAVLRWLRLVCRPDAVYPESTVLTVYYDTPGMDCLREKRNSDYLKTKLRLRWYRVGGRVTDAAFLEVKLRLGARREKHRLAVPYRSIWSTRGSLDALALRGLPRLLRPLGIVMPDDYRPVLLVGYKRYRFMEPHTGLRASLDSDIHVPAVSRTAGLTPNPIPLPVTVFEFKGPRDHLPESLRGLTTMGFRKASFSKYAACYDHALAPWG
jgi:hypothetical protein